MGFGLLQSRGKTNVKYTRQYKGRIKGNEEKQKCQTGGSKTAAPGGEHADQNTERNLKDKNTNTNQHRNTQIKIQKEI